MSVQRRVERSQRQTAGLARAYVDPKQLSTDSWSRSEPSKTKTVARWLHPQTGQPRGDLGQHALLLHLTIYLTTNKVLLPSTYLPLWTPGRKACPVVSAREVTLPGAYICFCVNCHAGTRSVLCSYFCSYNSVYLFSLN